MASGMKAQHKYIFLIFLILRSKTTHPSVLFEICKKTELQLQEAWWKNRHFGGQEVTNSRFSPSLLHPSLVLFTSLCLFLTLTILNCLHLSLSLSLANDASTLMWTSCRHPSGTTTILLTHIFLTCITWPLFSDGRRGSIGSQVRIPVKPNTRRKKEEKQCNWFTQAHVNCEN